MIVNIDILEFISNEIRMTNEFGFLDFDSRMHVTITER